MRFRSRVTYHALWRTYVLLAAAFGGIQGQAVFTAADGSPSGVDAKLGEATTAYTHRLLMWLHFTYQWTQAALHELHQAACAGRRELAT